MYSDDTFIVSYPKSGNTWVRFLLANALYRGATVDFHTIHKLIPEVGADEERPPALPRPRLFKSHAPYQSAYPRVIYILRDGRDVYSSYFHYRQPDLPDDATFEAFLEGDRWPTRWSEHVEGWMNAAASESEDVLVVRFEDLKENSVRELRRMLSFLGKESIAGERIQQAVKASSFENMRRLERERGRKHGRVEDFMRNGEAGGWEEMFTEEARNIFRRKEGDVLARLGYAEGRNVQDTLSAE
jgi:hypothetical protein